MRKNEKNSAAAVEEDQHRDLHATKAAWNLEQRTVASNVKIEHDPPTDTALIRDNPLFHILRGEDADNHDVPAVFGKSEFYGGVDVSFPEDSAQKSVAVYVVVKKETMEVVYHDHEYFTLCVPYIPGYLAFREIQPLELLVRRQIERSPEMTPQAILVDGNGILHPRHAGIACFLGTRLNIPTIGIGKSLLCEGGWTRENVDSTLDRFLKKIWETIQQDPQSIGTPLSGHRVLIMKKATDNQIPEEPDLDGTTAEEELACDRKDLLKLLAKYCNGVAIPLWNNSPRGDARFPVLGCALVGQGGQIGALMKSNKHQFVGTSKAIYVSVGHRVSLHRAVQVTASLCLARIPEPVRKADFLGRELLREGHLDTAEGDNIVSK